MDSIPFQEFPKISRLSRECVVTEKIDGTNAQILISDRGDEILRVGSRSKWITVKSDNAGFARWVEANTEELLRLGPGSHFGEWWGCGIGRTYNLSEKRFSLFDVNRWGNAETRPSCVHCVPELWRGNFDDMDVNQILKDLSTSGSKAYPGFMFPEGVVVCHIPSGFLFKKTLDKNDDSKWKSL